MRKRKISRASFIKTAAVSAVATGCSGKSIGIKANPLLGPKRIQLDEPRPMIPPVPAVLLTVKGLSPGTDEISVVWTFVIEGKPPQIGISVANEHVAQAMIEKHGEFVLNVPVADMIENFDAVDMNSSQVGDKFELSGLTRGKAAVVDAPTVSEAPIHAECKVLQMVIAPPNRKVFIAEVAATTVLDNVCDDDGRLLVDHVDFFGMTSGSGEFYTMGRKVGHIGKSVRRTDIKY